MALSGGVYGTIHCPEAEGATNPPKYSLTNNRRKETEYEGEFEYEYDSGTKTI
jgi:hypothetical protein